MHWFAVRKSLYNQKQKQFEKKSIMIFQVSMAFFVQLITKTKQNTQNKQTTQTNKQKTNKKKNRDVVVKYRQDSRLLTYIININDLK